MSSTLDNLIAWLYCRRWWCIRRRKRWRLGRRVGCWFAVVTIATCSDRRKRDTERVDCKLSRSEEPQHRSIEPQIEFDLCKCNYQVQYRLLMLCRGDMASADALSRRQLSITDRCTSLAARWVCALCVAVAIRLFFLLSTTFVSDLIERHCINWIDCLLSMHLHIHTRPFFVIFPRPPWPHLHIIALRLPKNIIISTDKTYIKYIQLI